jgi:hypothetical protein
MPRAGPTAAKSNAPGLGRRIRLFRDCSVQFKLALIKGFPYYVGMNITLSLDDELVKKVRKIAVEQDTTLTGMVREYLTAVASQSATSGRQRREREALERSFERFQFKVGKRTWNRADLYERS